MSKFINARGPGNAWVAVMEQLLSAGGKCFHLVVSIAEPTLEIKDFTRIVDALANETDTKSTMENANAIWPHTLAPPGQSLDITMGKIAKLAVPVIKEANPKHADSYVERLVAWRSRDGGKPVPQLRSM